MDRFFVALYSLVLVVIAILLAIMALGWTAPVAWLQIFYDNNDIRIGAGVVAIFAALLGLKLLAGAVYRPQFQEGTVITESANGKVHIAMAALDSLVHKASRQVVGVKEITPRIKTLPDGIAVMVRVSVTPDLSIPALTEELQAKIKDYIHEVAGIQVLEVKVMVEAIATDVRARVE